MRRFSRAPTWALIAALSMGPACASITNPSRALIGTWGGEHVTMTVADSTHLEFDCAHGDIPAVVALDGGDRFSASGTFVREHGGPIQIDAIPDSHPATYAGSVMADRMTLIVRLTDSGEVIGPVTLARGAAGRVVKCL